MALLDPDYGLTLRFGFPESNSSSQSTFEVKAGPVAGGGDLGGGPPVVSREETSTLAGVTWTEYIQWGFDLEKARTLEPSELFNYSSEQDLLRIAAEYKESGTVVAHTQRETTPYEVSFFFNGDLEENFGLFHDVFNTFRFLR